MRTLEMLRLSAVEQARLIRDRSISSHELTEVYLERIADKNPALSAFVHLDPEYALRTADTKDDERSGRGLGKSLAHLPPFHGVPMGIKDLNLVRGMFARFGSRAFKGFIALSDDQTTAQIRRGGFVILGKTSTSELGTLPLVETDLHPPTRNPWNLDYTAGGSSGGAASAVASGMLPIAQASDGAGSIRIPASLCGLVGIKPSRGRVHNPFGLDDRKLIYSMGPIGRTVHDVASMLDVMAGLTVGRPHWAEPPNKPFASLLAAPRKLTIRVVTKTHLAPTHPEVEAAVWRVARLLESLGHQVEEGEMVSGEVEEFLPVWQFTTANAPVHDWELTQPTTRWLAAHGKKVKLADVHAAQATMQARILAWAAAADIWLTPTVPIVPPKIFAFRDLPPAEAFARCVHLGPFTAPFNVSGQPAASVPAGFFRAEGLPIGVQVVGRPLQDATVLAVCQQIETALAATLAAERPRVVPWQS